MLNLAQPYLLAALIFLVSVVCGANENFKLTLSADGSTDQLGDTTYSYLPFTADQNGAGNIHEINGPWKNDTIRHSYDDLGRMNRREILHDTLAGDDEILHFIEIDFDHNSRLKTLENGLGKFQFHYNADNISAQIDSITNPAGMRMDYGYETLSNSKNFRRLKSIVYKAPVAAGGANLSSYEYDYDAAGRMTTQLQQFDASPAITWNYNYSSAGELKRATIAGGDDYQYTYDKANNRLAAYKNLAGPIVQHNQANQITQIGGAGESVVEGVLNELSKVKVNINGAGLKTAQVRSIIGTGTFSYSREVEFNEGNNTIAVEATDANGNQTTKNYTVNISASQKTYHHDLNGNLTEVKDGNGDIIKSYAWDGKNRLISITEGNRTSEFEYDGSDKRVRIIEKEQGVEMSNNTFLWCGEDICQKRNNTADTVARNYYSGGFTEGANKYYYTKDHLGSIREVVAANGTTIESRYDYTPFGEVTKTSGIGVESDFLYTGHYHHAPSKLHLTHYRAYDAELGRWLSPDPLGESQGFNMYSYVGNNPINGWDPLGLWNWRDPWGGGQGFIPGKNTTGRVQNGLAGGASGAAAGGATGAVVGTIVPGAGTAAGAATGAIGGGIWGFVDGFMSDPCESAGSVAKRNAVNGAIGGAVGPLAGKAFQGLRGASKFAGKTSHELSKLTSKGAKQWLKGKGGDIPSRADLERLREIATRAIKAGKQSSSNPVQSQRLEKIKEALKQCKH